MDKKWFFAVFGWGENGKDFGCAHQKTISPNWREKTREKWVTK